MGGDSKYKIRNDNWLTGDNIDIILQDRLESLAKDGQINLFDSLGDPLLANGRSARNVVLSHAVHMDVLHREGFIDEMLARNLGNTNQTSYIIPVNIGGKGTGKGNHWVLACLDRADSGRWRMRYADPLVNNANIGEHGRDVVDGFRNNPNLRGNIDCINISNSQQRDDWSCGYITIENAVSLASGANVLEPEFDTAALRRGYQGILNTARDLPHEHKKPRYNPASDREPVEAISRTTPATKKTKLNEPTIANGGKKEFTEDELLAEVGNVADEVAKITAIRSPEKRVKAIDALQERLEALAEKSDEFYNESEATKKAINDSHAGRQGKTTQMTLGAASTVLDKLDKAIQAIDFSDGTTGLLSLCKVTKYAIQIVSGPILGTKKQSGMVNEVAQRNGEHKQRKALHERVNELDEKINKVESKWQGVDSILEGVDKKLTPKQKRENTDARDRLERERAAKAGKPQPGITA